MNISSNSNLPFPSFSSCDRRWTAGDKSKCPYYYEPEYTSLSTCEELANAICAGESYFNEIENRKYEQFYRRQWTNVFSNMIKGKDWKETKTERLAFNKCDVTYTLIDGKTGIKQPEKTEACETACEF